jgi:hypothetical protein
VSVYTLQKLIREINRNPGIREHFFAAPADMASAYDLTAEERRALVDKDYGALYRLGVHGLLLRPFSILHAVSEQDYLEAIRKEPSRP